MRRTQLMSIHTHRICMKSYSDESDDDFDYENYESVRRAPKKELKPRPKTENRGVNKSFREIPVDKSILNELRSRNLGLMKGRDLKRRPIEYPHLMWTDHCKYVWNHGAFYSYSLEIPRNADSNPHITKEVVTEPYNLLKRTPNNSIPEIAIIGRSNVGKSSVLNKIAGAGRRLAKYSEIPGTTRRVSRYELRSGAFAVLDVPGYGFAYGGQGWWHSALEHLMKRPQLKRILVLLDGRRGLMNEDRKILEIFQSKKKSVQIQFVFNKCDLDHKENLARRISMTQKEIEQNYPSAMKKIETVSAFTGGGMLDLMRNIAGMIPKKDVKQTHKETLLRVIQKDKEATEKMKKNQQNSDDNSTSYRKQYSLRDAKVSSRAASTATR
uniref:EngB-type G domain-containing protein n=1 Tax=Timspurckia oligopyrenoides TaxID=708627 RepID=A0A7S0ZK37_9RHOD